MEARLLIAVSGRHRVRFGRAMCVCLRVAAVTVVATLAATHVAASDVHLQLSALALNNSSARGQPVLIRVTVTNDAPLAGWDSDLYVLVPRLTLGHAPEDWPSLQVTFEVMGPDGRPVIPKPDSSFERLAQPQLSWFSELHVGEFFGRTIDVAADWLGFSFSNPGRYTIRTTMTTGARRWLDSWLKLNHKRLEALPFSYEHVFEGTLTAAPVYVIVTE